MTLPAPTPSSTCLVTGASSGIGEQIARHLARRGHGLTLVARRENRLRELADELSNSHRVRVEVLVADLTDEPQRQALGPRLDELGSTVSVLINNAGFSTVGPVARSDRDRELAMIRTNVEAVADLCSMFVPPMVDRGAGAVLNVASTAAFQPLPGQAGYAASKAFVLSYSRALTAELHGTGVTVTALCPGPVQTEFGEVATGGVGQVDAGVLPKMMWTDVDEVARAAVEGLDRGRAVVIPGAANKVTAFAGQITPRALLTPLLGRMHPALRRDR